MRIEYQRTFSLFVDNYLATYFGTPGKTLQRLVSGPMLILLGAFMIIFTNTAVIWVLLKTLIFIISWITILYGIYFMLRPVLNILLVWLRREQFLGPEGAVIALELLDQNIRVYEGGQSFDIPHDQIIAVQRRAKSAWIITKPDNLVYFPFEDLLSGDADAFLDQLEAALKPEEEEE